MAWQLIYFKPVFILALDHNTWALIFTFTRTLAFILKTNFNLNIYPVLDDDLDLTIDIDMIIDLDYCSQWKTKT